MFSIHCDEKFCEIKKDNEVVFLAKIKEDKNDISLTAEKFLPTETPHKVLAAALDKLFSMRQNLQKVTFSTNEAGLLEKLQRCQFASDSLCWSRSAFYQNPMLWHHKGAFDVHPENWVATNIRKHPERRKLKHGIHYTRMISHLDKTLSIRTADPVKDLDLFHNWHNQPRVSKLWDLNWEKPKLKEYLEKGLEDAHQIPFIVELDREPVGYFEVYWVAEDRLAAYYEAEAYDRGFHFLIGNKKYLGVENTKAIVSSVMHYMFLDDPRTRRIMAEPRADNKLVLKYVELIPGWKFIKEFDFPHKRAALLMAKREDFFAGAL